MIGDTMETDIVGGVQLGYRTVLVLSGGTQENDLKHFAYRPDIIVPSVAHLCNDEFLNTPPVLDENDMDADDLPLMADAV